MTEMEAVALATIAKSGITYRDELWNEVNIRMGRAVHTNSISKAVSALAHNGYIEAERKGFSNQGGPRVLYRPTAIGRRALDTYLLRFGS